MKKCYFTFPAVIMASLLVLIVASCSMGPTTPTPSDVVTTEPTLPVTTMSTKAATLPQTPSPTAVSVVPSLTPTLAASLSAVVETDLPILYYGQDGHLYRTDLEGAVTEQLTTMPDQSEEGVYALYRPPHVSPNGRWLALNGSWGGAALLDLADNSVVGVGRGQAMRSPTWSPDSRRMAYLGQDNTLCIVTVPDLAEQCPYQDVDPVQEAAWSPDGTLIAVAVTDPVGEDGNCCTGRVLLLNPMDGQSDVVGTYVTGFEPVAGDALSWLPDSSGLLIKPTPDGGSAVFLPDTGATVSFAEPVVGVSPDSQKLLTSSGTMINFDGTVLYTLPVGDMDCAEGSLSSWAWSADGQHLAYVMTCGDASWLSVVETMTGDLLWQQALAAGVSVKAWSPDDHYLLLQMRPTGLLADASIERFASDGSGAPEPVTRGLFIDIVSGRNEGK